MHCLEELAHKYPQLTLPIKEGMKNTEEYRDICLKGVPSPYKLDFTFNNKDSLETINTKVGDIEVLSLRDRNDFIHAVRALGNKCEKVEVPDSTGAIFISGLNNWEKVRANLENYKDSIIILSSGNYSNVSNKAVFNVTSGEINLTKEEWTDKSIIIRKYHELTHFIMRKLHPEDIKPIRDELIADITGLIGAFGYFDERLLKLFLGIESNTYRKGGRLENYEGGEEKNIPQVIKQIEDLKNRFSVYKNVEEIYNNIERFM